jgi:aspartate 1-decarboxylase
MFVRKFLIGKIHRATVTGADVQYVGSVTVDTLLLEQAGILPMEEVDIWDVTNGERLSTYVLPGAPGSGQVTINGAAARRVQPGDKVIVAAYALMDGKDLGEHVVRVVVPDDANRIAQVYEYRVNLATRKFELVQERRD